MASKSEDSSFSATKESISFVKKAIDNQKDTEFLVTGNVGFDLALTNGQGLPVGSSVLFWAPPGCGKTTILADVCRRLIAQHKAKKKPFKVLYIAVEPSRELIKEVGLKEYMDTGDFIYVEMGLCWRQVEYFYDNILASGGHLKDVKLVIVDSLNNILSDANANKSVADGDFGTRARERTLFETKYLPKCREQGVTSLFIAQVRTNTDAGLYGPKQKSATSEGDKHNVEAIVKCTPLKSSADAKKEKIISPFSVKEEVVAYPVRLESNAVDCKNRYFRGTPAEVFVVKGKGCENGYVLKRLLEFNDYIKASGGWFQFDEEFSEGFGLPTSKMRKDDVLRYVNEKAADIVSFLQKVGKYNINTRSVAISNKGEADSDTVDTADVEEVENEQTED